MKQKLRDLMKEKKVTMRDLSEETGVSSALICYIAQGCAWFPEVRQLKAACARLGCDPSDLYTKAELHRYYPQEYPSVKRANQGRPRVYIDRETAEIIKQTHGDLQDFVRRLLLKQIRHDLMEEEGHYI